MAFSEEDLREFCVRRPWLHGPFREISDDQYLSLKNRDGKFWGYLSDKDRMYWRGFINGWKTAKGDR